MTHKDITGTHKDITGPWTVFWDMHSGGRQKEEYAHIYIQAGAAEARVIFYNRFGHSADRVSCTCCGEDYSVTESDTLRHASGYHRRCKSLETPRAGGVHKPPSRDTEAGRWWHENYYLEPGQEVLHGWKVSGYLYPLHSGGDKGVALPYWLCMSAEERGALLIFAADILPEERRGEVPRQGYVWTDE